MELQIAETAF
jgi:WD repeat-containing protein 19